MKRIGIVGLGNMGIGMAQNLVAGGFEVSGFDLRPDRRETLRQLGGTPVESLLDLGAVADVVFIMVLNGRQAAEVVTGKDGLLRALRPDATLAVSATIEPRVMRQIAAAARAVDVHAMDCPVSGGKTGADEGTLTMMVAADRNIYEQHLDILQCVGERIFHVGEEPGMGQTVKASLQAVIGTTFAGVFEALVLGSKAGVSGRVLYDVFTASGVRSPLLRTCIEHVLNREFTNTGSHIGTMSKDLAISMDLAREAGAAMFATSAATEVFRTGISRFPDEDNWACVKWLEEIAGTDVEW